MFGYFDPIPLAAASLGQVLLSNQIQLLWNEEFSRELGLGKYSSWALNITSSQIIPLLLAIGQYGRAGEQCPDIDTKQIWYNSHGIERGLDEILGIKLFLNQEQQSALSFVGHFVDDSYLLNTVKNHLNLSKI